MDIRKRLTKEAVSGKSTDENLASIRHLFPIQIDPLWWEEKLSQRQTRFVGHREYTDNFHFAMFISMLRSRSIFGRLQLRLQLVKNSGSGSSSDHFAHIIKKNSTIFII
jgi:hypothetical protein